MKPCACGGMLRRHGTSFLKTTNEYKIRLLCRECGAYENHYYQDALPKFNAIRQGFQRPAYVEQR